MEIRILEHLLSSRSLYGLDEYSTIFVKSYVSLFNIMTMQTHSSLA